MATTASGVEKHQNGVAAADYDASHRGAHHQSNPLAHAATNDPALQYQAFGGALQAGLYRGPPKQFANPAPLGLSAFALTTFVLSLINLNTRHTAAPNMVVGLAYGYGGFVQLLAGMWEMAVGNTFGATALSSYGGFWISLAIVLTPGGFGIVTALGGVASDQFNNSFGFFLMGWFIFTTILLMCTLRSTVMFFLLFFWLDLAFLFLGVGHLQATNGVPQAGCIKAGGVFGLLAAFWAWYNAWAGIADSTNSFFTPPVIHFPWSDKARERKAERAVV
jgi:succinate-acetate transporter protein